MRASSSSAVVAATTVVLGLSTAVNAASLKTRSDGAPLSFMEEHFSTEHHIGTFDLGSFFAVHDLNRDGVLDRSEIEAIYGVHHSLSVKHSENHEVHDQKADHIVETVLARLDKDDDGVLTKREFIQGGKDGLPSFPEYGKHALGHHYDEESEFFMHHEEMYHNTPETQQAEAYNHPEDKEHFAHHEAIEAEEEKRERIAEGLPSREEDERLKKEAEAKGQEYLSPYDSQIPESGSPAPVHEPWNAHSGGHAASEAQADTQHVFRGPSGSHVVETSPEQAKQVEEAAVEHDKVPERLHGETDHGYADRLEAAKHVQEQKGESPDPPTAEHEAGETQDQYEQRISRERFEKAKQKPGMAPPSGQGRAPNKYPPIGGKRKKGSFFGEF